MINRDKLQAAGIDYQVGLTRFMNDPDLYEAVLNAFLSEDVLERSLTAYDAHDYSQLLNVVHEAKGSSGNAGFDELYRISSTLVALLRTEGFSAEKLTELYQNYISTYEKVKGAVKAALNN